MRNIFEINNNETWNDLAGTKEYREKINCGTHIY